MYEIIKSSGAIKKAKKQIFKDRRIIPKIRKREGASNLTG